MIALIFCFFIAPNAKKTTIPNVQPLKKMEASWELGPFMRPAGVNPILKPLAQSSVDSQLKKLGIKATWQNANVFNPAATISQGQVVLLYRAESNPKLGVGKHVSRIGFAKSSDGIHFHQGQIPVLYPEDGKNKKYESPGGCEDPRVIFQPHLGYVMTYTGYDRKTARLCVAVSKDLHHWKKYGPAFSHTRFMNTWSKSGSIVCHLVGNQLEPLRVQNRYWMYWGEGPIHVATSTNLINWLPKTDSHGHLISLINDRPGHFDSALVEPGPPSVLTKRGIVFIYNGKNAPKNGDPSVEPGGYSAGQLLINPSNPTKVLGRLNHPFLVPSEPFEKTGQYSAGTVFTEGLVHFHHRWFLYFGEADSFVGVAVAKDSHP